MTDSVVSEANVPANGASEDRYELRTPEPLHRPDRFDLRAVLGWLVRSRVRRFLRSM
jgi:hypothetical protein